MSQERTPSYYAHQGAEFAQDDYWNAVGANFNTGYFDPSVVHDDLFDFGAEQDFSNAEFTGFQAPDPPAPQSEQILETSDAQGTSFNPAYTQGWSEVNAGSYTNDDGLVQPAVDTASGLAQPLQDSRNWSVVNTPVGDSGYGSTVMSRDNTHGRTPQEPYHFDNEVFQDGFAAENVFGHGQTHYSLSNVNEQPHFDEAQYWKNEEEIRRLQDDPAKDVHEQSRLNLDAEDWKYLEDHLINGDSSETPDVEALHEQRIHKRLEKGKQKGRQYQSHKHGVLNHPGPSPPRYLGTFPNYAPTLGDDQGWETADPPIMNSENGSASRSGDATHGLTLATQNQLSDVGPSSSCEMKGIPGDTQAVADPPTNEGPDTEDEDDEGKGDRVPHESTFETYEELDPLIIQDPPQNKWGRTGKRNGQEVWFNRETSKWQPSVSHHDMRETLIARAQAEYPNDTYLYPDKTDGLPHGETAFFKPHQYRGPHRNDCADALFVWREFQPKKDADGKSIRTGKPKLVQEGPGFMFEGDKILLDPHNNPVVNHEFIPLTLSSLTDGAKLQEMALHPGCQQADLWARMPRWERKKDRNGRVTVQELREKNTRINMPMTRFREKKGTIAGGDREGSDVIRAGLLAFYHHHGFDPVTSGNSTKGFWRDLEPWEVKQVRLGNVANFGARAGDRALNDETRRSRYRKMLESIEKGQRKQVSKNGGNIGKRPLEGEDTASSNFNPGPQKRRRQVQNVKVGPAPRYDQDHGLSNLENEYGNQNHLSHRQQDADFQGSIPPQELCNRYGAPEAHHRESVQQQGPFERMNMAPEHRGNTLGPGGRKTYQEPRPAPKKREHENSAVDNDEDRREHAIKRVMSASVVPTHNFESESQAVPKGPRPEQVNVEVIPDPDIGSSHKRRRNNETPGTDPRRQRRPQIRRTPRPKYYGAGGAPVSLISQEELGGFTEPTVDLNGELGGPSKSPEELFGTTPDVFDINGDVGGIKSALIPSQMFPENVPHTFDHSANVGSQVSDGFNLNGWTADAIPDGQAYHNELPYYNMYGDLSPVATPIAYSENPQRLSEGGEPQQILGKHQQEEGFNELGQDLFFPEQNSSEQHADGQVVDEETKYEPKAKRPRMPATGGYYAPPKQAPKAAVLRKARKAERDAHLAPPQFHIHEAYPEAYQSPQVEDAQLKSPQLSNNESVIYTNEPPQVAYEQGPYSPQAPLPAQAEQEADFDIRDVRPADGWQSFSLDNALKYTREAYLAWTGEEAPVTNLEDCYNVQYREIQAAFHNWWRSEKNPLISEPLPLLFGMEAWNGAIEDWKAPENFGHLLGPMSSRIWAAPNEDGSLQ